MDDIDDADKDTDAAAHPLLQEKYTGLETARLWKMFFWSLLAETRREFLIPVIVYGQFCLGALQFWSGKFDPNCSMEWYKCFDKHEILSMVCYILFAKNEIFSMVWYGMAQICPNMTQICPKWPKSAQNGPNMPKWPKYDPNGPKSLEMA